MNNLLLPAVLIGAGVGLLTKLLKGGENENNADRSDAGHRDSKQDPGGELDGNRRIGSRSEGLVNIFVNKGAANEHDNVEVHSGRASDNRGGEPDGDRPDGENPDVNPDNGKD